MQTQWIFSSCNTWTNSPFCTENMNMGPKVVSSKPPTPGNCSWSSVWALFIYASFSISLFVIRFKSSLSESESRFCRLRLGQGIKLFAEPVIWQSVLGSLFSLSSMFWRFLFIEGMLGLDAPAIWQSEFDLLVSSGAGRFRTVQEDDNRTCSTWGSLLFISVLVWTLDRMSVKYWRQQCWATNKFISITNL